MTTTYEPPPEVAAVMDRFRVAERSTLAKDGRPITTPACVFVEDDGRLSLSTSIGLAFEALNVRRNPKASPLYSEPTGCGPTEPPCVLFRGALSRTDAGWAFEPRAKVGSANQGVLTRIGFMRQAARRAARYLDKGGLGRPPVDWKAIVRVKGKAREVGRD